MQKILIATPSYDGKIDVWYTNSLVETCIIGLQNEIFFKPIFMSYDALIQRSRNDLIGIAVENEFDGILWIDADMEWNPQWAIDLVKSKYDVFGLPVIKKSITEESYNIKCKIEDLNPDENGILKVESVGTGFLYMSKKAYMHLWNSSPEYTHNGNNRRWVFDVGIKDGDIISEDVTVCSRLLEGGFDIMVDTNKTCNHVGNLKYVGNFASFIQRVKEFDKEKNNGN